MAHRIMPIQRVDETNAEYECRIDGNHQGPFKTYGKTAFTPEVPGQRLVKGKLVDVK